MAVMKSFESTGDASDGVSKGVDGKEAVVVEAGMGREGLGFGGAIGSVRERRCVVRDAVEADREERFSIRSSEWARAVAMASSGTCRGSVSSVLFPRRARDRREEVRRGRGADCIAT